MKTVSEGFAIYRRGVQVLKKQMQITKMPGRLSVKWRLKNGSSARTYGKTK